MASHHAHFNESPAQVLNQADLDATNEKLEKGESEGGSSQENVTGYTAGNGSKLETLGTNDRQEITEDDCYDELGFSFSPAYKWSILTVIFLVQVSLNFNSSLYSNAVPEIATEYGVSEQAARVGAAVFLVTYAFGCELWAPWSEELGRWPTLQLSMFLVNIFQLPVALAPNFATIIVGRALGGLASAGGSITLGLIADLYEGDDQQYPIAFIVFSSVGGSILGPIIGGFSEAYLDWRWCIWIQLIFGGFVELIHFFLVPETRSTIMMDKIARRRRYLAKLKDEGRESEASASPPRWGFLHYFLNMTNSMDFSKANSNIYGPDELVSFADRFSAKEILITWIRPFHMFVTEPIVLVLSLLSGFSDALIFMFIQSFSLVYAGNYNFSVPQVGLSFISIGVGYCLAWALSVPFIERNKKLRAAKPDDERAQYESLLEMLLYTAPCLPIGLFGFAWTVSGPPIPWIASMIFAAIIGIANYSIYNSSIAYMLYSYGPYSASATGGNGWSRDFLAGVLTVPATPFFSNIGADVGRNLEYATTILACISSLLVVAVYIIYWKGPVLRKRSPFAQQLADAKDEDGGRRPSYISNHETSRRNSVNGGTLPARPGPGGRSYSQSNRFFGESRTTPRHTPRGTPSASRANSISAAHRR